MGANLAELVKCELGALLHDCPRHDFSRWVAEVFRDPSLAAAIAATESRLITASRNAVVHQVRLALIANLQRRQGHRIDIAASIGVARSTRPGGTAFDLLRAADAAMYQAKSRGGAQTVIFDGALARMTSNHRQVATFLSDAFDGRRCGSNDQPIVCLKTGSLLDR